MPWSEPSRLTRASRTLGDPAYWNSQLKGNYTYLYDHAAASSAVHGLPAGLYPVGLAQGPGYHVEVTRFNGVRTTLLDRDAGITGAGVQWAFARPFRRNPVVFMGVGNGNTEPWRNWEVARRVAGVTPAGCELRVRTAGNTYCDLFGLAIGLEPDIGGAVTNQLAWRQPVSFGDGLLPYELLNLHAVIIAQWLKRNGLDLSNQIHGLAPSIYPLGTLAARLHLEALRYPPGDVGTQGHGSSIIYSQAFAQAYASTPVVVTASEFNADRYHRQWLGAVSTTGATLHHEWYANPQWEVNFYISALALGQSSVAYPGVPGWTAFGPDKGLDDTMTQAELNQVRDNALALIGHHNAQSGVHGLSAGAFLAGCARAGLHVEAYRNEAAVVNGGNTFTVNYSGTLSEVCAVLHSVEKKQGAMNILEEKLSDVSSNARCAHFIRLDGCSGDARAASHVVVVGRK